MKVRVRAGWQVNHDGKNLTDGEEFNANDADAKRWIEAGYVEPVEEKKSSGSKSTAAKTKPAPKAQTKPRTAETPDTKSSDGGDGPDKKE